MAACTCCFCCKKLLPYAQFACLPLCFFPFLLHSHLFAFQLIHHPPIHLINIFVSVSLFASFWFGLVWLYTPEFRVCLEYREILCNRPKQSTKIMKIMNQRKWQTSHSLCVYVQELPLFIRISTFFSIVLFLFKKQKNCFFLLQKEMKRKTKLICFFSAIVSSLCVYCWASVQKNLYTQTHTHTQSKLISCKNISSHTQWIHQYICIYIVS